MADVRPGDVLADRFVVEDRVGGGGIGQVFRGWDLDTQRPVAIKVLLDLSPTDVKRFEREAGILAEARLPGVVGHVHHATTGDGVPYLVMEWLDGETVAKRMESRGFDVAEAVALVATICEPLAALHGRGLVHRDLKPDNLVMTGPRAIDVVVIDLGLARTAARAETRVTATGCVLGTPGYMAPEQVRGDSIDARSDVFALGCVLYECITGYAAFAGENFLAVRTKILVTTPPSLTLLCPEVPRAVEDLVYRMIAKHPADRPESARAVATALAKLEAVPAGPKRRWSTERPPTLVPDAVLRPLVHAMPATVTHWTGLVLVHGGAAGDSLARRAQITTEIVALGDRLRAAALEGRVELVDGGYVVVIMPPSPQLAALAHRLAEVALALRALVPAACFAITSGMDPLDELIDRSARLLDSVARSALFDDTARDLASIFVDPVTATELAADFELDRRAGGCRLVGPA